jgi:hypothetical protein
MASICKLSLSVVTSKEPKMLSGSPQCGTEGSESFVMGNPTLSAYREGLTYYVSPAEQGKPVFLPLGKGRRKVVRWKCGQQRKEKAKAVL